MEPGRSSTRTPLQEPADASAADRHRVYPDGACRPRAITSGAQHLHNRRHSPSHTPSGLNVDAPRPTRPSRTGENSSNLALSSSSVTRHATDARSDQRMLVDLDTHSIVCQDRVQPATSFGSRVGIQHDAALATGDSHTLPSQCHGHHGRMVIGLPVQALERLRRNLPYGAQSAPAGTAHRLDVVVVVLTLGKQENGFVCLRGANPARIPGARSVCSRLLPSVATILLPGARTRVAKVRRSGPLASDRAGSGAAPSSPAHGSFGPGRDSAGSRT